MRPGRARRHRRRIVRTQQFRAEITAGLERYRAKLAVPSRPSGVVLLPTTRRAEPSPIRRKLHAVGLATVRFDLSQGLARPDATDLTQRLADVAGALEARTGQPVGVHATSSLTGPARVAAELTRSIGALSVDGNDRETLEQAARWLAQQLEAGSDLEMALASLRRRATSRPLRRAAAAAALAAGAISLTPSGASAYQTNFTNGTLTITLDNPSGENVTVTCNSGIVAVNTTDVAGVNCNAVEELIVNGSAGNDTVSLFSVSDIDFTQLAGATIAGGQGNDDIAASQLADVLEGGEGGDTLAGDAGNDRYIFSGGSSSYNGDVLTELTSEGSDTLDFTAFTASEQAHVNLTPPGFPFNAIIGQPGGISATSSTIAPTFEHALGGAGNDVLRGNTTANTLDGGPGDDGMSGLGGNDSIVGGTGTADRIFESADPAVPNVNYILTATNLTGRGNDTFGGIEEAALEGGTGNTVINASGFGGTAFLFGGPGSGTGNDTLIGATGPSSLDGHDGTDSLTGGAAGDTLVGGTGADTINGGAGNDTYSFSGNSTSYANDQLQDSDGVDSLDLSGISETSIVNLSATPLLGDGGTDATSGASTPSSFESVTTGIGNDTLFGNTSANTLSAGAGVDLVVGEGGNDSMDGGGGTADVVSESADVNITLTNTSMTGGLGTDSLGGFEAARLTGGGSANAIDALGFTAGPVSLFGLGGADPLTGTVNADTIEGESGNDSIVAGDGDDSIVGGADNDSIDGGDGAGDLLTETVSAGATLSDTSFTGNGVDTLAGIERASITGGVADEFFSALNWTGTATLSGEGGRDQLQGSIGADSLVGGTEDDTIQGSVGNDTIDGGSGSGDWLFEFRDIDFTLTNTQLVSVGGLSGTDSLAGIEGATLTGGSSANLIDASGFSGATELNGESEAAFSGGGDSITGGSGADTIKGRLGNDVIEGGPGTDSLLGGENDDRYVFDTNVGTAADTVQEPGGLGSGLDTYDFGAFGDPVTIRLGTTGLAAESGSWTLSGLNRAVENGIGGSGNDTIVGGNDANSMDGGDGSDVLTPAGPSGDTLTGGPGTPGDTLVDTGGSLTLGDSSFTNTGSTHTLASIEMATLEGTTTANLIDTDAFTGATTLTGLDGDDTITAGAGTTSIDGGSGVDSMTGGGGSDTIVGGGAGGPGGFDLVAEQNLSDVTLTTSSLVSNAGTTVFPQADVQRAMITGTSGNDTIDASGWGGLASLVGASGNDVLVGGPLNDTLNGLDGDDTISGGAATNVVDGGNDSDTVRREGNVDMTLADSVLSGGGGTDNLIGIERAHLVGGAAGNNLDAAAFSGQVTLDPGAGSDTLASGSGNDSLLGGGEADTINGGAGSDTYAGGTGNDLHVFAQPSGTEADVVRELASAGTDEVSFAGSSTAVSANLQQTAPFATQGTRTVTIDRGGSTSPTVENLTGGEGNDDLRGTGGINLLGGGIGNDSLRATSKDTINGGDGTDTMNLIGATTAENFSPNAGQLNLVEATNIDMLGGNDVVNLTSIVGLTAVTITGGVGNDTLTGTNSTLPGTAFVDILNGNSGNDVLTGGEGRDKLNGVDGTDNLSGGGGNDDLLGGLLNDVLGGGNGNDSLLGEDGDDTLNGGNDNDTLNGGPGSDSLNGGSGTNVLIP